MNPLFIAFIAVLLVPLFVASWRLTLFSLAAQGLLMATLSYQLDPDMSTPSAWIEMLDLGMVRGLGAPLSLYVVLRARHTTSRSDVIPPNLMSWTLAIALVLVAFRFADMLVPVDGDDHSFVAGATAGILLGLLVLATQTGPFSQMVGVLRIENAIALFELGSHGHELAIQIAQVLLLIITILMFQWYLRTLPQQSSPKVSAVEGMIT